MKAISFNQMRLVAGVWLVVFLFALGNVYLEWGIFGTSAKLIRSIVMFVGILALVRYGPRMFEEMNAHIAAKRESEGAAERARDKSNDTAEGQELRRSLGMPTHASGEQAAQQSVSGDSQKPRT